MYPTNGGTLSFEGSAGQLLSITNSLSGTIYSVNDVSGIPSIEVLDTGVVKLAQYNGLVGIGTADFSYVTSDNTSLGSGGNAGFTNNKLFVNGSIQLLGNTDAIVFGRGTSTFIKDEEIGFGWGSGWYMQDASYLRVRNNKSVYSTGDARFAIMYDTDNTGYYVDPGSVSVFNDVRLNAGNLQIVSNNVGRNTKWRQLEGSTDVGITFYNAADTWCMQLYANAGSEYGFLNGNSCTKEDSVKNVYFFKRRNVIINNSLNSSKKIIKVHSIKTEPFLIVSRRFYFSGFVYMRCQVYWKDGPNRMMFELVMKYTTTGKLLDKFTGMYVVD